MPQVKQGGITVDAAHELPVADTAHVLQDRANALDGKVQAAQESRRSRLAAVKPEGHAIGGSHNKGLKPATHVHHVFKHPKG